MGDLTVVAGVNASGKSNLREAFRFLHGIARGYSVAEILGEKWSLGGVQVWSGIRGGLLEAPTSGKSSFALEVSVEPPNPFAKFTRRVRNWLYRIEVDIGVANHRPRVVDESLHLWVGLADSSTMIPYFQRVQQGDRDHLKLRFRRFGKRGRFAPSRTYINAQPMLPQIVEDATVPKQIRDAGQAVLNELASCRFLDLSPMAMRMPSLPGQIVLGDRGDNLSSVLQAVCADPGKKSAMLDWVRQLTPMDATDFEFPADQTGRVLLTLVEKEGRKISAYSASDGTLRLLAIIAALMGTEPARFYFLEELENGIHPNRLALLIQLLEATTGGRKTQVVATTHSPQLLRLLGLNSLASASVVYRLPGTAQAQIKRIVDIPHIEEVLKSQDLARLHESGWLEDVLTFAEGPEPDEQAS